jgi:hypothetical protein
VGTRWLFVVTTALTAAHRPHAPSKKDRVQTLHRLLHLVRGPVGLCGGNPIWRPMAGYPVGQQPRILGLSFWEGIDT